MSENTEYRNESGRFTVDEDGFLISFTADRRNEVDHASWLPIRCDRAVRDLHIPEGVRFIGRKYAQGNRKDEHFCDMLIMGEVAFPGTLLALGDQTFSRDIISKITLPPTLRQIGCASFLGSLIYTLETDKEILQYDDHALDPAALEESSRKNLIYGGRSFKESTVQEVRLSGKDHARFYRGNPRIGIAERTDRLTPEAWIRFLMPEAEVSRVVCTVFPGA